MDLKSTLLMACGLLLGGSSFGQISAFPYQEAFESEGQGGTSCGDLHTMVASGWANSTTDQLDWTSDAGGTTSGTTGPSVDQFPGTSAGTYMYIESSSPCYSQTAELLSPEFVIPSAATAASMDFWYHMYGSSMGTLSVDITSDGGTTWTNLFSGTDNIDLWQQSIHDITAYAGNTVQFRFVGTTGTNYFSDMAIDNFNISVTIDDDLGAESIDNPASNPITPGVQFVTATVKNYGANTVNTGQVNWSVNGTVQTPVALPSALASGASSASIILGTYNFPIGSTDICVWTSIPNGNPDNLPGNDTLCMSFCTGLNGTYTIGGTTPDYSTFAEAANDLMNCGVSGPVVFNVAPGTYNESVTLNEIVGASTANTITFEGGSASTTTIEHDGSNYATINLDGADFITFQNFTIRNTGTVDAWGVHLTDIANYDTIRNCIIDMYYNSGVFDVAGIVASGSKTDDFTEGNNANFCGFIGNTISGGEMGIHLEGLTTFTDWMKNMTIEGNTLHNIDDYGIYMDNQAGVKVIGNTIDTLFSTLADGIYTFDIVDFNIEENYIHVPDYGISIQDGNFSTDGPASGTSTLTNNMVTSETDYGIYLDDVEEVNIFHNSVYNITGTTGAFRANDLVNADIRNNVFASETDYAFESLDNLTLTGCTVDYNLYWTNGTLFITEGGTAQADLAAWQTAQPTYNTNSVELDPAFSSADLHMVSIAADDLGDNTVGVSIDIDGDSRPAGVNVDMGADEYTPLYFNASLDAIIAPEGVSCGENAIEVIVLIKNLADTIFTCPVTVEITGAVTQTLTATYNDTILFNEVDTLVVGTIDTYAGGTINMTAYTQYAGDQDQSNDTLYDVTADFIPFEPVVGGGNPSCGLDSAYVWGDTTYVGSYFWYDAATGGNLVGTEAGFWMPNVNTQDTYYIEYKPGPKESNSLVTTLAAGNGCGGGNMFDVTSTLGNNISGFRVHSSASVGTPVPVNVYYKTGTYVGSEALAGNWTLEGSYTVASGGSGNVSDLITLNNPITLPAGQVIGIYVEYDAEYTNGNDVYTYGDITVSTGAGLCSSFGGVNASRMFNGQIYFDGAPCSTVRTPVQANITPAADVNLGDDIVSCEQYGSLTLDPGTGLTNHIWQPSGNTGATETISSNGQYIVTATDGNNCTNSDTVLVIFEDCASIEELGALTSMNVFPNPSNGFFTVQLQTADGVAITGVEIVGLDGKIISSELIDQNINTYNNDFDLSGESRGVYFLRVITTEGSTVEKLIVE